MASYKTLVTNYMKAKTKKDLEKSFAAIQNKLRSDVGEACCNIKNVEKIIKTLKGSVRVIN